jgi:NADH dehydrogenase (ubiquinone) Fe-S protein 6
MTHAHNLAPAEDRAAPSETSAPETTVVDSARVWCDGSGGIRSCTSVRPAALGHPRVWLQIDESGYADCGYCDRRFVLKGGPADTAAA